MYVYVKSILASEPFSIKSVLINLEAILLFDKIYWFYDASKPDDWSNN